MPSAQRQADLPTTPTYRTVLSFTAGVMRVKN
jgi:hypothetical protein